LHKTFYGSHDFAYAALDLIRQNAPSSFNPDQITVFAYQAARSLLIVGVKR
jgi:hypothetical protein